jgi:hypothetical protein
MARFPVSTFGNLCHKRWRLEETFKRLEHRLKLEHVSGLLPPFDKSDSSFACRVLSLLVNIYCILLINHLKE